METFLQHTTRSLTEEYLAELAWLDSASVFVASAGKIPISTPIWNRVFGKDFTKARHTVFHVTKPKYLADLIRLQGKKKSISAFLSADQSIFYTGVRAGGGMILELDAHVLISSQDDIFSTPDDTGRRWVDYWALSMGNKEMRARLQKGIEKIVATLYKKYANSHDEWTKHRTKRDPKIRASNWDVLWREFIMFLRNLPGNAQTLRAIVRDWIDACESLIHANATRLRMLLFSYLRSTTAARNGWDELVVNQFRIKKVHTIGVAMDLEDNESVQHLVNKYRIPWKDWGSGSQLSSYIQNLTNRYPNADD